MQKLFFNNGLLLSFFAHACLRIAKPSLTFNQLVLLSRVMDGFVDYNFHLKTIYAHRGSSQCFYVVKSCFIKNGI